MARLREWVIRVRGTLRPSRRDAELEEELRLHLELAAEDEGRRANAAGHAKRAAVVRSGGLAQAMEALRDQRGLPWLDSLRRDLRDAWRAITRNRGFTVVVTATLGAGLALCLTVVSVVNAYLMRPLPYPNATRLYSVVLAIPGMSPPEDLAEAEWAALDDVVDQRIAWDLDMFYLLGGAYAEAAPGTWVTRASSRGWGSGPSEAACSSLRTSLRAIQQP